MLPCDIFSTVSRSQSQAVHQRQRVFPELHLHLAPPGVFREEAGQTFPGERFPFLRARKLSGVPGQAHSGMSYFFIFLEKL